MAREETTTSDFQVPGHRVVRLLGHGARSTLWQTVNLKTGQVCALKHVQKDPGDDDRYFLQVYKEYEIGSAVAHPNVRKMFSLRKVRRMLALRELMLFMEFCSGKTVEESPPTTIQQALDIFTQVAYGLEQMNAKGYAHADMKPNNIIVDREGVAKIIDLGHSCELGTIKERIQGTPDYIAPEQVNRRPIDTRTDVFNYGASFYWTLAGKPIPSVLPQAGTMRSQADRATQTNPSSENRNIPPILGNFVADCVKLRPNDRPQTMREVLGRLELIYRNLGLAMPKPPVPAETPDEPQEQ